MLIQRMIQRVWTNGFCPFYLRLKPEQSFSDPERIHRWASQHHFRHQSRLIGWVRRWIMALLWPWRLLYLAQQATRQLGPTITAQTGKRQSTQFLEQVRFGLGHGLSPLEYYRYGCYQPAQQPLLSYIILQQEVAPLSQHLNPDPLHPDPVEAATQAAIIADKVHFATYCRDHNLPTPPILALFADGKPLNQCADGLSVNGPGCSFFAKPLRGSRGQATQLWQHVGKHRYAQHQGAMITWPQVEALLQTQSIQQAMLVQPLLVNHSEIAELAPGNLATIRLLTGRTPNGEAEALAATLMVALHAQQIISTHGLNSPIHLEHGTLGRAYTYHPLCPGYDEHPITQAAITGHALPDWPQAVALARLAHKHLPHFVFLGWDIALTPDGPMLLEGNAGWETLMVQKPQQTPLGQTRFLNICLQWLERQA